MLRPNTKQYEFLEAVDSMLTQPEIDGINHALIGFVMGYALAIKHAHNECSGGIPPENIKALWDVIETYNCNKVK